MKHLIDGLHLIAMRRDGRVIVITATSIFILLLLALQNGEVAITMFDLKSLDFSRRVSLFFKTFFDITSTVTVGATILAVLGSLLSAINIALVYVYIKTRGELLLKSGLYSGVGLIFAFLGIGCAACSTAFLSLLLGFFGFSAVLDVLPYKGQEIGYVGLVILSVATYALAKKVTAPAVC